jgi:hypothetical protein
MSGLVDADPSKRPEATVHFKKGYATFPDIVALNQIALAHEMLGEFEAAMRYFLLMKEQAQREANPAYLKAANLAFARIGVEPGT